MKSTEGLILAIFLTTSLAVGVLTPSDLGKVNPVHGQTPVIDQLQDQYVSVFPSNLPSTMSSEERGRRGTAAAVQWFEKVEYDGTKEYHTVSGSLNFVPFNPYWKAAFINLTAYGGQGWLPEDIRESDATIASRAGFSVSSVPDFNVRSVAPETIKSIRRELIHDYLPIKYKFTLEWDETPKSMGSQKAPIANSQKIYIIIDRWGLATGNSRGPGYDVLWILMPPPTRTVVSYNPADYNVFGGFPYYVDFTLRSRKTAWADSSQQLNYVAGGPVLTETQFLLMWGNHWGGGSPYLDESSPDLGMMLWYPRFGISDPQYLDEQWRDQKITHVKISNPPVWGSGSVSGPTQATVGTQCHYLVRTTDPDGHLVWYGFEDILYYNGTLTGDVVEGSAGRTVTLSVVWNREGTYRPRIMACDQFGAYSWSLPIVVTVSTTIPTTTTDSTSTRSSTRTATSFNTVSLTSTQSRTGPTRTVTTQTTTTPPSTYTARMPPSTRTVHQTTTAGGVPRTITSRRTIYTTAGPATMTSWRTITVDTTARITATSVSLSTSDTTVTTETQQLTQGALVSIWEIIRVMRTIYMRFTQTVLSSEMTLIVQVASLSRHILVTPVVEVLITVIVARHYGPLPPEATEPTILDTLGENAAPVAIAAVSIIAACLFVMKKRGVKPSSIRQRLTTLRKKNRGS